MRIVLKLLDTRPLRVPAFRRLWVSTAVTAVGSQLTAVAVPLQIYRLTGSSAQVGLAGLAGFLPLVAAALWGGAVADAADRRRLLLVGNTGIALVSVLLWAQAAAGLRSVGTLLALVAVQQAFFGANATVRGALVPRLVDPELLPAANALQSTAAWFGGIAGPLLAGTLVAALGTGTLYLLDALALLAVLPAVRLLPPLPPSDGASRRVGPREIADGLRCLRSSRVLLTAYLVDFLAMVLGLPVALFPQAAHQVFGDPAGGGPAIGVLSAALSLGALLTGCCSGLFTRVRRHGAMVTAAVCTWGLAIAGLGTTRRLWLAALLLALSGGALVVLGTFRKSILQSAAPDAMRGRLQGIDTVVGAGGPRLAGLVHGVAGAAFGASRAISAGGVLAVLAMGAVVAVSPAFWRYSPAAQRSREVSRPRTAACTSASSAGSAASRRRRSSTRASPVVTTWRAASSRVLSSQSHRHSTAGPEAK
ncbi:MFS family permease [Kitasatospora sp. MAA4]|nr:MFS family permease [Kitasatospora sp. MAA4]